MCAPGRTGLLCSECSEPGYGPWGGRCQDCSRIGWLSIVSAIGSLRASFAVQPVLVYVFLSSRCACVASIVTLYFFAVISGKQQSLGAVVFDIVAYYQVLYVNLRCSNRACGRTSAEEQLDCQQALALQVVHRLQPVDADIAEGCWPTATARANRRLRRFYDRPQRC